MNTADLQKIGVTHLGKMGTVNKIISLLFYHPPKSGQYKGRLILSYYFEQLRFQEFWKIRLKRKMGFRSLKLIKISNSRY